MIYLLLLPVFFLAMHLYFRIAARFNIIDCPNERSSHSHVTIRGGGIIFLLASVAAAFLEMDYWLPLMGIFIIGVVSFVDDHHGLPKLTRLLFHLIAVTFIFIYLNLFSVATWYWILPCYILTIGMINAYNFMDGINGITGAYSLAVLGGLQLVNLEQFHFIDADMIWLPLLTCVIFLYFNFRHDAKCFAGDVGSVTIGCWVVFLTLNLILTSDKLSYILFLAVYAVDSVLTILHRLWLRQNIFKAHRFHFYQLLTNENGFSHLIVSIIYVIVQMLIILWIVYNPSDFWLNFFLICFPLVAVYLIVKPKLVKRGPFTK